jgi:tight adherence protein C
MSAILAGLAGGGLVLAMGRRRRSTRRPADGDDAGRRVAVPVPVLVAAGAAWAIYVAGAVPAALGAVAVVGLGRLRARRRLAREAAAIERAVPELVDLLRLATSAGQPVRQALEAVARRAPALLRPAIRDAVRATEQGLPLAVGLERMAERLGPAGTGLVAALDRSAATGAALGPLLAEVAADARDARRRSAQEAARRLPVSLLFPLVCCTLPAAVLVAVVPVVVVALGSLRT